MDNHLRNPGGRTAVRRQLRRVFHDAEVGEIIARRQLHVGAAATPGGADGQRERAGVTGQQLHAIALGRLDDVLAARGVHLLGVAGVEAEESADKYYTFARLVPRLKARPEDAEEGGDYFVDLKDRAVSPTEAGIDKMERLLGIANLYDADPRLARHFEQALRAHALYKLDRDYIVKEGEIVIVDEFTGRLMPGRRWSDGLHQAVEAKEGVKIANENQTLASVTFQNYFRMYKKLGGMTGTADTEAAEFAKIYNLDVNVVPTNRKMIRLDYADVVYRTEKEKFAAIVEEIKECHERGQPVLVGTISIEKSEKLSGLLSRNGVKHNVLNAKQHEREAEIVAQAGRKGAVTIATNMAGRGTDILLGGNADFMFKQILYREENLPEARKLEIFEEIRRDCEKNKQEVVAAGGLHILGTERHESRRIDNQLRGRSGRQGDPGSSRFYLSLEDNLMRIFGDPERIKRMLSRAGMKPGEVIESKLLSRQIERAQRKVEAYNFDLRKNLLEYDDVANDQRKVIYGHRNDLMASEDIADTIKDLRRDVIAGLVAQAMPPETVEEHWNLEGLRATLARDFSVGFDAKAWVDADKSRGARELEEFLTSAFEQAYAEKEAMLGAAELRRIERTLLLQILDSQWREHLAAMDYLRQGIHLRSYAQKDYRYEYKREAYELFTAMLERV